MSDNDRSAGIDAKALRRCLGSFATGVAVITTRHDDRDVGITVNSFTSLSLDPPLVLWCLAHTSRTYAVFTEAEQFIVNILAVDQVAVSNRFAFRSDEAFPDDVPFRRALGDIPLLEGTSASFQCRRADLLDGGDHSIVVGEVVAFAGSDRPGLVYHRGQYAVTDAHPSVAAQSRDSLDQGFLATTVRPALEDITHRFEAFFDEALREAGISSRESQVLGLLLTEGALSGEDIANQTLVSGSFLGDTLESLSDKALVVLEGNTFRLTPDGRALAADWLERLRAYRAQSLGTIAPQEAAELRRILERLSEWIDAASG